MGDDNDNEKQQQQQEQEVQEDKNDEGDNSTNQYNHNKEKISKKERLLEQQQQPQEQQQMTVASSSSSSSSSPSSTPTTTEVTAEEPTSSTTTPKDEEDILLIQRALSKSPFFTCLDTEQINAFIQYAQLKTYKAGETIILEGCLDNANNSNDNSQEEDDDDDESDDEAVDNDVVGLTESDDLLDVDDEEDEVLAPENNIILEEYEDKEEEGYVIIQTKQQNPIAKTKSTESSHTSSTLLKSSSDENNKNETAEDCTSQENMILQEEEENSDNDQQDTIENRNAQLVQSFWEKSQQHLSALTSSSSLEPPSPPTSGNPSYLYIIRNGQADVLYSNRVNPASLGQGTVFGEGGFLFNRQHSASIVAASSSRTPLECWVVDINTFKKHILPSTNMKQLYQQYATQYDPKKDEKYMTMQDFVQSCLHHHYEGESEEEKPDKTKESDDSNRPKTPKIIKDPLASVRIANTFHVLQQNHDNNTRKGGGSLFSKRISLADFCLFHLLMARPDPEIDITFMLMDVRKRGVLYKEDVANFLKSTSSSSTSSSSGEFDMESEFIQRHFGSGKEEQQHRCIRPHQFSQFLVDLRREIGQQAFLRELRRAGTPEGYLSPTDFVRLLKTACGWRLPDGVADRLESIYCKDSSQQGLPPSSPQQQPNATRKTRPTALKDMESRERRLGDHYFSYCDFLAYQEVLGQLPGICTLIDRACEIKKGPVSADDFKVANQVLGTGGRLSRRQVDIIFQLFDLDKDGFVSYEDTVSVAGIETAQRLDAVAGSEGKLTFAPPSLFRHHALDIGNPRSGPIIENFALTSLASVLGVVGLYPLELCKTRIMNQRPGAKGEFMYRHSLDCLEQAFRGEGFLGLYRGLAPNVIGLFPEKVIKFAVHDLVRDAFDSSDRSPDSTALNLCLDMLAGGCAGACQLLVTNPAEILKIRLQVQGETARVLQAQGFGSSTPQSLTKIAKTLGYSGLFTGARACLLRDIPFSAIYFPTYSWCKDALKGSNGQSPRSVPASNFLLAGALAAIPASILTT